MTRQMPPQLRFTGPPSPRRGAPRAARMRAGLLRRRRLAAVAVVMVVFGLGALVAEGQEREEGASGVSALGPLPPNRLDPDWPAVPNVYAADTPSNLATVVRHDPPLVYVPNTLSNTVQEIDQRTFRIVRTFSTGTEPQHVTPSYDLRTLYVDNDIGNSLTPIDPRTGVPGRSIPLEDPYNLYFTPDGRYAIVVAERMQKLDFRRPRGLGLVSSLPVPMCPGVDHMDFSADGRYAYASCEFGGRMIQVDVVKRRLVRTLVLAGGQSSPQDVKLSPDGRLLFAADQAAGGLWEIDAHRFKVVGFLKTGAGAHGLYPSRDASVLYVSNRSAGSVSVVSFKTLNVIRTWTLPGPASPDMGGVSVDGRTLWLSGRYDAEVYAIDTRTGRLRARIKVGQGPHGLSVWPQPGEYSLGHTGIMR